MSPQETLVLNYVIQNPGCTSLQITEFTQGNYGKIRDILSQFMYLNLIKSVRAGKKSLYYPIKEKKKK